MALMLRTFMFNVLRPLADEDYFVVYDGDVYVAAFYLLRQTSSVQTWGVTGVVKPFAGNCDDFASYDEALGFIVKHQWAH
jgi:hypothetical protein